MRRNVLKLNIKSVIAVLLVTVFILASVPVVSAAEVGGDCGKGVKWSLSGGMLTISGKGAMKNYEEYFNAPWQEYAEDIVVVKVEKGVTKVGDFAFFNHENLTIVSIADSVKSLGKLSFYGCKSLSMVDLGTGLEEIGFSAFETCESLVSIRLPSSLKAIRGEAFYRCSALVTITIPESVTTLEPLAFTYCSSLKSVKILADIDEVPYWCFYGCNQLTSLSLSDSIKGIDVQAFDRCDSLTTVTTGASGADADEIRSELPPTVTDFNAGKVPASGSSGDYSYESTDKNGNSVTTSGSYRENENASVSTEITHTKGENSFTADVTVDATIENSKGWSDVRDEVVDAMNDREFSAKKNTVQVNVNLKGDPEIKAEDLELFAGRDINVTIHTNQGTTFEFKGTDIVKDKLSDTYDLSYVLTFIDNPSNKQKEVIGNTGYLLVFNGDIDFKFELLLPLGKELALDTAVFFSPERDGGYTRMQASVIDADGIAHFYLAKVSKKAEYLIGFNVPNANAAPNEPSDAIIPDELAGDYPQMDYNEPIQYVITDVKSSWGLSFNQVTWILFGGMGLLIVVVGVIVYIMFKSKQRNGMYYDPVLDGKKENKKSKLKLDFKKKQMKDSGENKKDKNKK